MIIEWLESFSIAILTVIIILTVRVYFTTKAINKKAHETNAKLDGIADSITKQLKKEAGGRKK